MNLSKYFKVFFLLSFLGIFFSCSEEVNLNPGFTDTNKTLTLTIDFPDYIENVIGTRDFQSSDIINIAFYDSDKNFLGDSQLENTEISDDKKTIKGKISKISDAKFIHVFVNVNRDSSSILNPYDITLNSSTSNLENILWGYKELDSSTDFSVSLIHPIAQVKIEADLDNFTLKGYEIYGVSTTGKLLTEPWSLNPVSPTIPSGNNLTAAPKSIVDSDTKWLNVFETNNTKTDENPYGNIRILLKGEYNGVTYYYPLAFAQRKIKSNNQPETEDDGLFSEDPEAYSSLELLNILRNHRYSIKIQEVRAEGWSFEDALKAKPDNRISVFITEENMNILDVIACKDYAMGITSTELSVAGKETSFEEFYIVHNYKTSEGNYPVPKVEIVGSKPDWFNESISITSLGDYNELFEGTTSTSTAQSQKYQVKLNFNQNIDGSLSRSVKLKVSVGDLSREVTFTQEARDYLRDGSRKVSLYIPDINGNLQLITDDYFKWLDETCKGVKPKDNRGVVRNDGLILPPVALYKNSKNVVYRIPNLNGYREEGKIEGTDSEIFNATEDFATTYFEVTVNVGKLGTANRKITDNATFTITVNSTGEKIVYKLYSTGFFHELTEDMIQYQCPVTEPKTGWYYYELVKKGDQYIMDRNIGASNNAPYISTYVDYLKNEDAVGGYFQIATERYWAPSRGFETNAEFWNQRFYSDKTVLNFLKLNLGNYDGNDIANNVNLSAKNYNLHIPSIWDLNTLNVSYNRPNSGVSGNASYVATITNLDESKVKDNKIFIPHGGYYEGNTLKLSTRATLWTSTIYSDSQGFHPDYEKYPNNNFGFWYYYLEAQPKSGYTNIFNQLRCNDATESKFSDATVTRYMPIRLVFGRVDTRDVDPEDASYHDYDNDENYFHKGNKITVKWGNNYVKDRVTYWYHNLYAGYFNPDKSVEYKPLDLYPGTPFSEGQIGKINEATFTIEDNTNIIYILANNNNDDEKVEYSLTPNSITFSSGKYVDGSKCKITEKDESKGTYIISLW